MQAMGTIELIKETNSDEEDPDEYPFPLTLRAKSTISGTASPLDNIQLNGN